MHYKEEGNIRKTLVWDSKTNSFSKDWELILEKDVGIYYFKHKDWEVTSDEWKESSGARTMEEAYNNFKQLDII